jgi:hypothetical protein
MALVRRELIAGPHSSRSIAAPVGAHRCNGRPVPRLANRPPIRQKQHQAQTPAIEERQARRAPAVALLVSARPEVSTVSSMQPIRPRIVSDLLRVRLVNGRQRPAPIPARHTSIC